MFFHYARLDSTFALCVMEIGSIWTEGQKADRKNRVSQNGRQFNAGSELMKWIHKERPEGQSQEKAPSTGSHVLFRGRITASYSAHTRSRGHPTNLLHFLFAFSNTFSYQEINYKCCRLFFFFWCRKIHVVFHFNSPLVWHRIYDVVV